MSSDASSLLVEGIVYAIPLAFLIYAAHEQNKAKAEKENHNKRLLYSKENTAEGAILDPGKPQDHVSFHNEHCALSINNDACKITIINENTSYNYTFNNIVNVEIDVDGNSVASPSLGGAAIGGLLFGGAGAIVGSSYSTTKKKIKTITLKIFVDDLKVPYHRLVLFSSDVPVISTSPQVCAAQTLVNEWYSRFTNIIEKRKYSSNERAKADSHKLSIADEIAKLADLLKSGAISQEEFDALKKKLLGV